MNDYQKRRFAHKIVKAMFNTITGIFHFNDLNNNLSSLKNRKEDRHIWICFQKRYGIQIDFILLCLIIKGDTRESSAAYVMKDLLDERANLAVYDPQVIIIDTF